jgi:hypothetical protein
LSEASFARDWESDDDAAVAGTDQDGNRGAGIDRPPIGQTESPRSRGS